MLRVTVFLAALACAFSQSWAQPAPKIGVVVMHGKAGSPGRHVAPLASALENEGFLVANLEMPWSGARNYDVDVPAAEKQVQEALEGLRAKGAGKLFVSGHSQGGLFAIHLGGRLALDGIIPIAPGGNVAADAYRQKIGASLDEARKLVADGKGAERRSLLDMEGGKVYPVGAVPAAYVSWFDPEGAMNEFRALGALNANLPVLLVVPTRDYPGLLALKDRVFSALPSTPYTRLYQPQSDHLGSPAAAAPEVARWIRQVAEEKR